MLVVAITRWAQPLDAEVQVLAPLLSVPAYDLKLRLAGPLPVVLARVAEPAQARELLGAMRARGHGAVACDLQYVHDSATMISPKGYQLDDEQFVARDPAQGSHAMPHGDILALIRAMASKVEHATSVTKSRGFSFGRAALTAGLMHRKTNVKRSSQRSEEREQVLYMIRRNAKQPILLRESRLRHEALGERRQPTSLANFLTLVALLRERAPDALYDERILKQRRKSNAASVTGSASAKLESSSNASDNDLAAHLLAVAHLKGQL